MSHPQHPPEVSVLTRSTCGSCRRMIEQVAPIAAAAGARLVEINVDHDAELAAEFGDRVPVLLVDEEEFACWEVDEAELADLKRRLGRPAL